mgnify:CR=1 FL=1
MLFILKSYLKFLWNSKNEHGVHSPFVFDLVTKCFYDTKKHTEYSLLKEYRKSLLKNKNYIEVSDYGAGSKVFKSNKRQISKIAQTAGISQKRAELLFQITNYFKPDSEGRKKLRAELEINEQTLLLGCVGRFDPQKDHRLAFAAACFAITGTSLRLTEPGVINKSFPEFYEWSQWNPEAGI